MDKGDNRDPDDEVRDFIKELESRYVTSNGDRRCETCEFCIAY